MAYGPFIAGAVIPQSGSTYMLPDRFAGHNESMRVPMTTKRIVASASALALSAMLMAGAASAATGFGGSYDETIAPTVATDYAAPNWHYAWGYHYVKGDRYVPGWIAVLNQ
jgi:hypothetical protein